MAGHVQQLRAVSPSDGKSDGKALSAKEGASDRAARKRPSRADAASQPPPLPLDEAEAELCERLTGLLSTAPRRCCEETPMARVAYSDRIATMAELVPELPALPPLSALPELPAEDASTPAAPVMLTIKWVHRSRRERIKTALGYSGAWTVTLAVIAMTVVGATVLTLGADRSTALAGIAGKQGAEAAMSAAASLRALFKP